MNSYDLQIIQERIGYHFKNPDLLQQAFVRRSYAKENGGEDNEVLEFIGDRALDIVVVKILVEMFGFYVSECDDYDQNNDFDEFCCEYSEGKLTNIKKKLVCKKTLANCIDRLGFADLLILGRGDQHNHIEQEDSVKEDLFEAIIGAVVLDSKWNWEEIQSVVEYMLEPRERLSEKDDDNYVELIQEWSLKRCGELPRIYVGNADYSRDHSGLVRSNEVRFINRHCGKECVINVPEYNKTHFRCELILKGIDKVFISEGNSKSEARKIVCEGAYNYLDEHNLLFSIRDEIDNPNKAEAINQLEILARRGYFSIPSYEFEEKYDKNGNPVWKCFCNIKERKDSFSSVSSSKKDAKKSAAFKMLKNVLENDN